ncbi:MAG: hypothetical protein ACYC1C_15090 [Chloroflexota bacterium]
MGQALALVRKPLAGHLAALLAMNLLYFGALGAGIAYTAVDPRAQARLTQAVGEAFAANGVLTPVLRAYQEGSLGSAAALTFLTNLVLGSGLDITLPSLIVPFAGLAVGVFRAILWGVLFSPLTGTVDAALLPHTLTVLLEGEAYVVAMWGVWLWWQPVLRRAGERGRAWGEGLRLQVRIYAVVAALLAVAATYEALEVIYLIPFLQAG